MRKDLNIDNAIRSLEVLVNIGFVDEIAELIEETIVEVVEDLEKAKKELCERPKLVNSEEFVKWLKKESIEWSDIDNNRCDVYNYIIAVVESGKFYKFTDIHLSNQAKAELEIERLKNELEKKEAVIEKAVRVLGYLY